MRPVWQTGARTEGWSLQVSCSDKHLTYLGRWSTDGEELDAVKTKKRTSRPTALPRVSQAGEELKGRLTLGADRPGAAASVTQLQSARLSRGLLLSYGVPRTRCHCVFFKEEETCRSKGEWGQRERRRLAARGLQQREGAVKAGLQAMIWQNM